MSYIRSFIKRGLLGILIGAFINQFVYFILALSGNFIQLEASTVITQFAISTLVGFYCSGVSVIFDIEEWSLLRQTIVHSILMLPYFPIAVYAGWMPVNPIGRIVFALNYILVYFIIWFSIKRYWQKKAREINKELKKWNN